MEAKHDYAKVGFKAGLEIHQQLDTGKLFCACPSILRNDAPTMTVTRKLHAVAGELGEVDAAVTHEAEQDKTFYYQYYKDTNCLVELDEEPPHFLNGMALEEALKLALLLHCEIYQDTQIMRKTVIDGSNTSGFQRTVLLAHSGWIDTSFGRMPVDTLALEEDSARLVSEKKGKEVVFRLDRLGIPLVEIATSPVIQNPEQVKETALKLGELLRACKVKRGIGTIRQDVNVSIRGHDRVEIKGFQEPSMMVETINLEIARQLHDLEQGEKKGDVRGALENGETVFLRPLPGRARMYPETDLPLLHIPLDLINRIKKHMPKLRHELKEELKKKGLSEELMKLVLGGNLNEFETLLKVHQDAPLVAKMISLWRNEFATKSKKNLEAIKEILKERVLEQILEAVKEGKISEGEVKGILWKIVQGQDVTDALKIKNVGDDVLEQEIRTLVEEKPGLREGAYMGMLIQKMKDVDKRKAIEILKKLVTR